MKISKVFIAFISFTTLATIHLSLAQNIAKNGKPGGRSYRYVRGPGKGVTHFGVTFPRDILVGKFKYDFLSSHNKARAEVGIEPVTWNATVEVYAIGYASKRTDCKMEHSKGPYGENLAMSTGEISASRAVNLWVSEKHDYDYNSNSCKGAMCGHYTQVVWRDTKQIGCAKVQCLNGGFLITCNYNPPGNYIGQRPY